jgi:hypothetical protein
MDTCLGARKVLGSDDTDDQVLSLCPIEDRPWLTQRTEIDVLVAHEHRFQDVAARSILAKFPLASINQQKNRNKSFT